MTYIGMICYQAPCTLSSKHTRTHIPHLHFSSEPTCQIWAIPGHLAVFAPAEPRSTSAPQGASLMAQHDLWLSSWGWHPQGDEEGETLFPDNNRVWKASDFDKKTWVICTHGRTHAHTQICAHFCENDCENIHRALKLDTQTLVLHKNQGHAVSIEC